MFLGICLSYRKKEINSSLLLRNVIFKFSTEFSIFIYSPLFLNYYFIGKKTKTFKKLYFFRYKPIRRSFVKFRQKYKKLLNY